MGMENMGGAMNDMVAATIANDTVVGITCEEVLHRLATHDLMDEIKVSNKYLDYAAIAKKAEKNEMSATFYEMAYEEFTHAKVQEKILLEHGYSITENASMALHDLKERLKTFRG